MTSFIFGAILGGSVIFIVMCCAFVGKDKAEESDERRT